jgi:hypothetical protein
MVVCLDERRDAKTGHHGVWDVYLEKTGVYLYERPRDTRVGGLLVCLVLDACGSLSLEWDRGGEGKGNSPGMR